MKKKELRWEKAFRSDFFSCFCFIGLFPFLLCLSKILIKFSVLGKRFCNPHTLSWKSSSTENGGTKVSQPTPTVWKKSCCSIQLFLPLLLTEIQGVSCSSLGAGDSLSSLYMCATRKVLTFCGIWILATTWMPWEAMSWREKFHILLITISLNKAFLKPGGIFEVVAAAVKTEIGLCVL